MGGWVISRELALSPERTSDLLNQNHGARHPATPVLCTASTWTVVCMTHGACAGCGAQNDSQSSGTRWVGVGGEGSSRSEKRVSRQSYCSSLFPCLTPLTFHISGERSASQNRSPCHILLLGEMLFIYLLLILWPTSPITMTAPIHCCMSSI